MGQNYYLYILRSQIDGRYYKGVSKHPQLRLEEHNRGKNPSTKAYLPWRMVYSEVFSSRTEALQRERQVKKWRTEMIESLIATEEGR